MNSTILVGASSLQLYIFSADRSYSWIHLSREIQSFEFWDVACFFWKSWFDSLVICNQNRSCFLSEAQVKHLKLSVDCCGVITKYLIPVTAPKNKSSGWTQTPGAPCILWHKKFNHFGIWQKNSLKSKPLWKKQDLKLDENGRNVVQCRIHVGKNCRIHVDKNCRIHVIFDFCRIHVSFKWMSFS